MCTCTWPSQFTRMYLITEWMWINIRTPSIIAYHIPIIKCSGNFPRSSTLELWMDFNKKKFSNVLEMSTNKVKTPETLSNIYLETIITKVIIHFQMWMKYSTLLIVKMQIQMTMPMKFIKLVPDWKERKRNK